MMNPIKSSDVVITDRFWTPRIRTNREKTILYEYKQCKKTGRIDAYRLEPDTPSMTWKQLWMGDAAKWIEAASYSLAAHPDAQLKRHVDEAVNSIVRGQKKDGYLHCRPFAPEKRWTNLRDYHELYDSGHLMEAAVAYFQATGKCTLLKAMCRNADLISRVFGPGKEQKPGYCGHPEIELALVKLYRVTGEKRYLNLSQYFVDQRGQKPNYFDREAVARGEDPAKHPYPHEQYLAHTPVRKQKEAVGHSVRAMYLYSAMADLALENKDKNLFLTCQRLWESVCTKKMYITGGIGFGVGAEKFISNYDLPNETAYAETCAAIGLVFWNHRMLQITGDNQYADVMERALYNGILSGVSLDGEKFFYVNPLASSGNHHRQGWFDCACCPPNLARLLASLGQYIYSRNENGLAVHLYIGGTVRFQVNNQPITLKQETDYPWDGRIRFSLKTEKPITFCLSLRIPGWCQESRLKINGQPLNISSKPAKGYIRLKRPWKTNDRLELDLAMPVEQLRAHPDVRQDAGCVALQRGPLVYCLEEVDHNIPIHRILLAEDTKLTHSFQKNLLGGVVAITGQARMVDDAGWKNKLYQPGAKRLKACRIFAVPYYAWDNRQPGTMQVWLRKND
ncbi:MAG: beta-L-arabinofuranosidase domain-containing protein [Candidatus Omnitrophota bacterium]